MERLVLPARLREIRSFEFNCEVSLPLLANDVQHEDPCGISSHLARINHHLPNLRRLYFSLAVISQRSNEVIRSQTEDLVLEPFETLIKKFSALEECHIGLQSSLYDQLRKKAIEAGEEVEMLHKGQRERFWRKKEGVTERNGYWVCLGMRDYVVPYVCTMGEGGYDHGIAHEDWVFYSEEY